MDSTNRAVSEMDYRALLALPALCQDGYPTGTITDRERFMHPPALLNSSGFQQLRNQQRRLHIMSYGISRTGCLPTLLHTIVVTTATLLNAVSSSSSPSSWNAHPEISRAIRATRTLPQWIPPIAQSKNRLAAVVVPDRSWFRSADRSFKSHTCYSHAAPMDSANRAE